MKLFTLILLFSFTPPTFASTRILTSRELEQYDKSLIYLNPAITITELNEQLFILENALNRQVSKEYIETTLINHLLSKRYSCWCSFARLGGKIEELLTPMKSFYYDPTTLRFSIMK